MKKGADVAVWTMNDLKIVVKEFIKLNGGQEGEEEPPKPKQAAKKISIFDILGETKSNQQPQIQKSKAIEPQKATGKNRTSK